LGKKYQNSPALPPPRKNVPSLNLNILTRLPKEINTTMIVARKPVQFQVESDALINIIPAKLVPDEQLEQK